MAPIVRILKQSKLARGSILISSCPIWTNCTTIFQRNHLCRYTEISAPRANLHTEVVKGAAIPLVQLLLLLKTCPGCGAYTQDKSPSEPGFYSAGRKDVKHFITQERQGTGAPADHEAELFSRVVKNADQTLLQQLGFHGQRNVSTEFRNGEAPAMYINSLETPAPVCDRCHHLRHHNRGVSVTHPTLQSIRKIISESPYKYNHVYHVLDAADFPLSLIPSLQQSLSLSPPRSLNRRSKRTYFKYGRTSEMSYIIARSDLLAPKKEQVDKIMPYIIDVLRTALGGSAQNVRLGNVYCVSSKRGWWTRTLKEDIYNRGGGGWMVGKVNVGKSNLFENVFPKGRTQDPDQIRSNVSDWSQPASLASKVLPGHNPKYGIDDLRESSKGSLESLILHKSTLPPKPEETPFPTMPLVSSCPGTTASPIRLSFGNRKGELIDLPGLNRGGLEPFVIEDRKCDLVMQDRIKAKQLTIKTGQSLLVGGLIQITCITPDLTILAYPFVPLQCHVASREKAHSIMMRSAVSGSSTIARPGMGTRMRTAGKFSLRWDVTKQRAGPLTARAAVGLNTRALPFVVLSTDILIEGCGWVELVAQVRKKEFSDSEVARKKSFFVDKNYPVVEIVSPDGRHVGYRRPMGAWLLGGQKPDASRRKSKRPRRSMRGVKRRLKKMSVVSNLGEK